MLFGATVAVYCENDMEHTNTLCVCVCVRERERERERKKVGGSERHYILGVGARKYISGFEGSEAVPACLVVQVTHMIGGVHYSKIYANVAGGAILGRNFHITNGRAACEACSATWNLRNN
jgi:hypothetical protein